MVEYFSEKEYEDMLTFIKGHRSGVSQPDIIKHFTGQWYAGVLDQKARIKIGYRLKVMEKKGVIEKRKIPMGKGIPMNQWRVKDDRTVSEIPGEI